MNRRLVFATVLFLAAVALLVVALRLPGGDVTATTPFDAWRGDQPARPGCLLLHGWNVCNYGDATLKDSYLRYKTYLGQPVSGFDGACQTFELGRLCYNAANPDDWQVEFDNLGLADLTSQGYTPLPGADPHPAVRAWLLALSEVGVEPWRVAGRIISEPVCERGRCSQWSDKTRFSFPEQAVVATDVQRETLGIWATHPRQLIAAGASNATSELLPLAGAAVLGVAGLAMLLTRRRGMQRGVAL